MAGGAWRDREYRPLPPVQPVKVATALDEAIKVQILGSSQLLPFINGIIVGAILGTAILWLVIPYLPFAGGR